ncbi:MAG TPA: FtsK/SpoIIIE domain-containing protein [Victivallales bacterium]|nr:FtsK/SpoIIIE domain-containing protein [Victivallales bacterium]
MEKRYKIFAEIKTRSIASFNSRDRSRDPKMGSEVEPIPDKLPYIVIIIDELADIMMNDVRANVEISIARIAQKGRAAGIHMIIATQTPRVNILTGIIKANIPARIAFRVQTQVDSRVTLDDGGVEILLGKGDMLFKDAAKNDLRRIQAPLVLDEDIERVIAQVEKRTEMPSAGEWVGVEA